MKGQGVKGIWAKRYKIGLRVLYEPKEVALTKNAWHMMALMAL